MTFGGRGALDAACAQAAQLSATKLVSSDKTRCQTRHCFKPGDAMISRRRWRRPPLHPMLQKGRGMMMKGNPISRQMRVLLLGATALSGACLFPAAAQAQDSAAAQSVPSAAPTANQSTEDGRSAATARTNGVTDANQNGGIADIIVTAEKHPEGLQNVPIAITALSGSTLEKSGVKTVGDLTQLAPSLQFGQRSTNNFIALRGIGQAGQDIGSQSGVTVSLDGVPLVNQFMMNSAFLDVERVEVLRGPQGTFQGRNATGGAINVYSNPPTDTTDGAISFNIGDYDRIGVNGYVNAPLSNTLFGRFSFQTDRADGWLKNGYNDTRYDNSNFQEVRGQLLYKPSDAFSVRALVDYAHNNDNPEFNVILGRADPALPTPTQVAGYPYPQNNIQDLTVYMNEPNDRLVNNLRTTLAASYHWGNGSSLTSTTGYIDYDMKLKNLDVDLTPAPTSFFNLIGISTKQVSEELTYFTNIGSHADLTAGAIYMHSTSGEPLYLSLETIPDYLVYLPTEKLNSYAGYAQFRYNLTSRLRATIGGRYTRDEKSYVMDATVLTFHTILADKSSWGAFTPRFVLDYTPNSNSLIYASVSRGFKSGGFNTLGDITQPVNRFNPEYVWNYELGLKASMFDKRLRFGLTGFYSDYTNLQQTVFRIGLEGSDVRYPRVENASSATIKGVEFEAQAAPFKGLLLTGAVTRLDAKFGKFCNNNPLYTGTVTDPACVGATADGEPLPAGAEDLQDNTLPQAPKWQFNTSAQYVFPISSTLQITAHADYKWQSRVFFDIYNNALNAQDRYGLLNASLGIGSSQEGWSLSGWVRNAFDTRYISEGTVSPGVTPSVNGTIGMPRMYGATFTVNF
ncbi:MAG: TonB-dependent receptor [Sphingomonas sp.]